MNDKQIDRIAFICAYRVLTSDVSTSEYATPGRRRTYTMDSVAKIIRGVIEAHSTENEGRTTFSEEVDAKNAAGEREKLVSIR